MKKILVNLKDWFNLEENKKFAKYVDGLDITLFPAMPYLYIYRSVNVELGSQDVSSFKSGAHTGSVSIEHLSEFGIDVVILNHNELRIEDESVLYDKVYNTLLAGVKVVICINDTSKSEIDRLTRLMSKVEDPENVSIAYEPKEELTIDEIKERLDHIRKSVHEYKIDALIYGGSVSKDNILEYEQSLDVDGYLISRHALDIDELKTIISSLK